MLWKIYAWIYGMLMFLATLDALSSVRSWNIASWLGVIEGIVLAMGALFFAHKKVPPRGGFWKAAFVIISISWLANVIFYAFNIPYPSALDMSITISKTHALLTMFLSVPALIAMFRMGFAG